MHLLGARRTVSTAGAVDEFGVDRELLAGGGASEQVEQEREVGVGRYDFLDADQRDVDFGRGQAEAGVAFVGHEHEATGVGRDEIRAGDPRPRPEVFAAHEFPRAAGDGFRIIVIVPQPLAFETAGDVATGFVDDRTDDVARVVAVDLHDVFAEVAFDGLDPLVGQVVVEVDFLGDHAFRFDHLGDAGGLQDAGHRLAGVIGRDRVVNLGPAGGQAFLRLRKVGVEVLEGVLADGSGQFAQAVGIGVIVAEQLVAFLRGRGRALVHGFLHGGRKLRHVGVNELLGHGAGGGRRAGFARSGVFGVVDPRAPLSHRGA